MSSPYLPPPLPSSMPEPSAARVHASSVVCWCLITFVCVALVALSVVNGRAAAAAGPTTAPAHRPGLVDAQSRIAGQVAVALQQASPAQARASLDTVTGFIPGTTESHVAMAAVAGEVLGRDVALERLGAIDDPDAAAFAAVYAAAPASQPSTAPATGPAAEPATGPATAAATEPASDDARPRLALSSDLHARYGWFADLAESFGRPDTDAQRAAVLHHATRTATVMTAAATLILGAVIAGVGCFITAIVLIALGKFGLRVGRPAGPSQVYVEAFTLYLVALLGIGLLPLGAGWPLWARLMLQSLSVVLGVAWPFLRGVRWATLRQDWGVHTGRGVLTEMAMGVGGYLAGLPVVAVAFFLGSLALQASHETATHPVTTLVESHPWLILLLASGYAPLTEELMFRGALVSHLRGTWGVVIAAVLNGVVFASVHPQGWALIPALASIGAVFGVIRQWRGSLIPSMTAHALNNGVVVLMLLLTQ